MAKKYRLPYDYMIKYTDIVLTQKDRRFIAGCLAYQKSNFQLNKLQWEAIKNIEKRHSIK
tara:strand:- start:44 stop:223 length:180 start_codon:yes stop_codon:yes gene_type:complete